MNHMARRQPDKGEEVATDAAPPSPVRSHAPVVMWIGQGPVCVNIIDAPVPAPHDGACHCGGCHGVLPADCAWQFY
jgi:hypothetical protein